MDYYVFKDIDKIDKLISYYQSNNAKIDELNTFNDLLKNRVVSLMRSTFIASILTNTDIKTYDMAYKYIKKDIKRGHEDYKTAKDYYKYILDELHKISPNITSIKSIIQQCGYCYNIVAVNLVFDLNDNEFELYVPIVKNLAVEDVFHNDYINTHANEFQLYARTSSCSVKCIWTGTDISKINCEVDLTKNYALK